MEEISLYLDPVKNAAELIERCSDGSIGKALDINDGDTLPSLSGHRLALVGVAEGRGTFENEGVAAAPQKVREQLYPLFFEAAGFRMLDLGDIRSGHTLEDTLFAVEHVCVELLQRGIIPMVIGGGQVMTLGMYRAYCKLERQTDSICIDPRLDIGDVDAPLSSENFLSEMILHKPSFLFNHSVIGYQTYLVNREMQKMMDRMYFDTHRLGEVVHDLSEMESVIRGGDLVSIDMSVVRRSDSPAHVRPLPNGLYGEQLCQLCSYAGMNGKTSSIGIFEFNPSYDIAEQSAQLIAQAFWCFIDGYHKRHKEEVGVDEGQFMTYRVLLKEEHELVFHKSTITDRWWMEVPYPTDGDSRFKRMHFVPCSYRDYQTALEEEMPDRWWKTYQKLS